MTSAFTFSIPEEGLDVVPVLRIAKAIENKDYILVHSFDGNIRPITSLEETPAGLHWSTSLNTVFEYLPNVEIEDDAQFAVLRLAKFKLPLGTSKLRLELRPWNKKAAPASSVVSDLVIETHLLGRPTVIFKETD